MNKRVGAESLFGVGGGTVSEVSRKNLEIAEDLCRKRKPIEALPYLDKALKADDANLDAYIQLAFLAPTLDDSIEVLESAEHKGRGKLKQAFGPNCFDDDSNEVGNFWSILETRPYMRVLQSLVRLSFENKRFDKCCETITEMLRLCPGDNMKQRSWFGSVLLKTGRTKDALHFSQAWMERDTRHHGTLPSKAGCDWKEPSQEPLTQETIDDMSQWTPAEHLYTAAYASFKLWGDCELARQYLHLAVKMNPNTVIKILAKVEQPKSLNMSARSINGPEEAHDYLWLAQDLWMAEDVWNWANSQEATRNLLLRKCSRDGCNNEEKSVAEFKRCAACHEVWYCGPQCQKQHWKQHKKGGRRSSLLRCIRSHGIASCFAILFVLI
ncbi:unnamed protein product [Somion occarium]|uniref:MYND-type domain-containing protein n=1 Tax=Somion occarium TaxID=3059160 RepID=A0ABP1D344_9APHY